MALIKWGALVTDGRGKIGGQVLTRGRSGAVIRNKVTPTNPKTAKQSAVRALLAGFSQGWKNLSQAQRDGWNAAVDAYSKTNVFGDAVSPSGKNLYTALNLNLSKAGYSTIDTAPTPEAVVEAGVSNLVATVTGSVLTFDFANGSADQKLYVQASPPVSAGINNISNRISHIATIDQTTPATEDIWSEYVAVYGAPAAGTKIFIKVQSVREDTGQVSAQTILSAVVGA
jgi:hypothetical protein